MKGVPAKTCPSCGERYDADVLFCPRDGTPLASSRNPSLGGAERDAYLGAELPGQIKLEHLIGIGSMGRVYRAFQGGIERDVAVKVLHRELSGNAELVARFHREAKVASRLVHPNVVQVLMTGALPPGKTASTGGELYLVMEYLDGISLLSALAAAGTSGEGQALPLPRALHIALQICDAAGEAHAQGIVHRDLKPENVMLVRRGDDPDYVKILDFGIARLDWADRGLATQAGLIFGTAKYISPEGAEGQTVGPPADVYSIATMLYQMLSGRTPFEGDSPVALLVQHTSATPPPLRSIARASYVPEPLAAAVMANLSKKPGERAANARALGRELIAAARAGGLFPEEIATQSTLLSPASLGAVKLASKERTRSHELSADLATKIGGVAAAPSAQLGARARATTEAVEPPARAVEPPPLPTPAAPSASEARQVTPAPSASEARQATPAPSASEARQMTPAPAPSRPSTPGDAPYPPTEPVVTPVPSAPRLGPGDTVLEAPAPIAMEPLSIERSQALLTPGDAPYPPAQPGGTLPGTPLPTMTAGSEAPVVSSPARARPVRWARAAIVAACVAAAIPAAVVGGRKLGAPGATTADSVEAVIEDARECMRRRAWDAPAGHNFKELTDGALRRWPGHRAVLDVRREAAVSLVNDALGRKYANDVVDASRLAQLALEMDPELTTAQHLAAELASARAPDVAPAQSASAPPVDRKPPRTPRVPVKPPAPPGPAAQKGAPAASASPPPPTTGAVLPPPSTPKPPAPTGPWL